MENSQATPSIEYFYSRAIGKHLGVSGGSSCGCAEKKDFPTEGSVYGGADRLDKYANSIYSATKEQLIRGLAKDIAQVLKMPSTFAETAPIEEVITKFKKIVPNPRENRSIVAESDVHRKICTKLAEALNKRYDMKVIDLDAEPAEICKKAGELLYSLFNGLHTEFLTIAADVTRTLSNLEVLKKYVDAANQRLVAELNKKGDAGEAKALENLYNLLATEIDRQHHILANLTDTVITPSSKSLVELLENSTDFAALNEDLKKSLGTPYFGEKLGLVLHGTSMIAEAARVVDKALQDVGMSIKQYKDVKSPAELKNEVYKQIVKHNPSSKDLYKMLKAADVLYRNDMAHDDIVKYLEERKVKGGDTARELEPFFADMAIDTLSVDNNSPFKGRPQSQRLSIDRQLKDQQVLRKRLFSVFNTQLKEQYKNIQHALGMLGKKIGGEVKITPELDLLIKQLNNFANSQPDRENIHIALSGYMRDPVSNFVRYQFIESILAVEEIADEIVHQKQKGYEYVKQISDAIKQLISSVDQFHSAFIQHLREPTVVIHSVKGSKIGGVPSDSKDPGSEAEDEVEIDEDDIIQGVEIDDEQYQQMNQKPKKLHTISEEDETSVVTEALKSEDRGKPPVSGGDAKEYAEALKKIVALLGSKDFEQFKTMKKSIREINYYYRISNVKKNLLLASEEYKTYTENYENILGEEAAFMIDQVQKQYNLLIQGVEEDCEQQAIQNVQWHQVYLGRTLQNGAAADSIFNSRLRDNINAFKLGYPAAGVPGGLTANEAREAIESAAKGYKFLLEYMRTSTIEMIEAAEALDIFLSKFTREIQLKPDQIKDFLQILEQIEVVAKWFTDKSGDKFAAIFEAFQNGDPTTPITTCSAYANTLTVNNQGNIRNPLEQSSYEIGGEHYYETFRADDATPGRYYLPRILSQEQAENLVKQMERAVRSVRSLENIISTFSKVNVDVSSDVKTFMSSGLIFKAFMKYIVASSIAVGYYYIGAQDANSNALVDPSDPQPNEVPRNARAINMKMGVALRTNKWKVKWNAYSNLVLHNPLKVNRLCNDADSDMIDDIFIMSIKSMITKVFTVVGSYDLFQRPIKDSRQSMSMPNNPLRQIMGGSNVSPAFTTRVNPKATELYIRLPLLAEWYRKVFDLNQTAQLDNQPDPFFTMIPDMDSIYGPFLKLIMVDARDVGNGAYPAQHAQAVVKHITDIYEYHAAQGKSTKDILQDFVVHVNRRYGLVMRSEISKYIEEQFKYTSETNTYPDDERVDYDLLGQDEVVGRNVAPSDRFRSQEVKKIQKSQSLQNFALAVRRLRENIESELTINATDLGRQAGDELTDADYRTIGDSTLEGIIMQTKMKIDAAADETEKFKVVFNQLHGIDQYSDLDQQKILVFHETVITPLTTLFFVYLWLDDFNRFFNSLCLPAAANSPAIFRDAVADRATMAGFILDHNYARLKGQGSPYTRNGDASRILLTPAELQTYLQNPAGGWAPVAADRPIQNIFNVDLLMEDILRKLMKVGCDMNHLTDVYIAGNGPESNHPVLAYDKMQQVCVELLAQTKDAIHQLRPYMPAKVVKQIQDLLGPNNDCRNVNSLFFLEQELFVRLFDNQYGLGLVDANKCLEQIWTKLSNSAENFDNCFKRLIWHTREGGDPVPPLPGQLQLFPHQFLSIFKSGNTLSNPVSKEEKDLASLLAIPIEPPGTAQQALAAQFTTRNTATAAQNSATAAAAAAVPPIGIAPIIAAFPSSTFQAQLMLNGVKLPSALMVPQLYNYDDKINNITYQGANAPTDDAYVRGLVVFLNNLIFKYVNIFMDPTSKKIYRPLIEKLVLGVNSNEIMNDNSINDGNNAFPEGKVIFQSIANALKNIMTIQHDKISGTSLKFVEDNFVNINEYNKELLRAHLPSFKKEFEILLQKANFLKNVIEQTPIVIQDAGVDSKQNRIDILGRIMATSKVMSQIITDVEKELNDVPLFMETYKNSIVDYQSRNGKMPLMPLSQITFLFNFNSLNYLDQDNNTIYKLPLIPIKEFGLGSPEFKFTYGTRGLLSQDQEISLEFAPGVKDIIDSYNSSMSGFASYSKEKTSALSKNITHLGRWITDVMYHNEVLNKHDWAVQEQLLNTASQVQLQGQEDVCNGQITHLTCQAGVSPIPLPAPMGLVPRTKWQYSEFTANIVDNDDKKQAFKYFLDCINNNANNALYGKGRDIYRKFNILDMNIVPINVHAMQREIPFVNLLNYAYSFDEVVKNFIGVALKQNKVRDIEEDFSPVSVINPQELDVKADWHPEDTLVRSLIHPLGDRYLKTYINNIYRLMAGNTSQSLNKPKFLSDQLWNKVLLNSLYTNRLDQSQPDPTNAFNQDRTIRDRRDLNDARRVSTLLPPAFAANNTVRIRDNAQTAAVEPINDGISYMIDIGYHLIQDLTFITTDNRVVEVIENNNNLDRLTQIAYEGYLRYNTRLIRITDFLVQAQRVLRLFMRDQLAWSSNPVVKSHDAIAEEVTEYKNNNIFRIEDFE